MIENRKQFGAFCESEGFKVAIEVGVHQACFAYDFLADFNGRLYCIDPWLGGDREFFPAFVPGRHNGDFDYELAKFVLGRTYMDRAVIIRDAWENQAKRFTKESIDFGYIDGLHTVPFVKRDIQLMWPLIRPGGVMAGHDMEPNDPTLVGVAIAVFGFCYEHGLSVDFTREGDQPRSWFIRKPV